MKPMTAAALTFGFGLIALALHLTFEIRDRWDALLNRQGTLFVSLPVFAIAALLTLWSHASRALHENERLRAEIIANGGRP